MWTIFQSLHMEVMLCDSVSMSSVPSVYICDIFGSKCYVLYIIIIIIFILCKFQFWWSINVNIIRRTWWIIIVVYLNIMLSMKLCMVFYFFSALTKQNTKRTSFDLSIIVNKCIFLEVQHIFFHLRLPVIASDLLGFFCSTVVKCFAFQSDLIWNNVFAIRDEPDLFGVWRWLSCKFCVGISNPLKSV